MCQSCIILFSVLSISLAKLHSTRFHGLNSSIGLQLPDNDHNYSPSSSVTQYLRCNYSISQTALILFNAISVSIDSLPSCGKTPPTSVLITHQPRWRCLTCFLLQSTSVHIWENMSTSSLLWKSWTWPFWRPWTKLKRWAISSLHCVEFFECQDISKVMTSRS